MIDDKLKYKIAISLLPNIGPILAKRLIAFCGSLEAIFHEKRTRLEKIPGIGKIIAFKIYENNVLKKAEEEAELINKNNIKTLFYLDNNYPERLKQCEDAPVLLYYKGDIDFNKQKILSIVGTRKASDYGKEICKKIIQQLSQNKHEAIIVSGLAYGIDIAAHRAALDYGLKTVAVLGHGLNFLYPKSHLYTAEKIENQGALVSEFGFNTSPEPQYFAKRNRIIAGLCDATIVIESARRGGALITADIAHSYNRDVFAIPGRVGDKYSEGCNHLIKSNKAALIENINDLEYQLGWENKSSSANSNIQKELFIELSDDEKILLSQFNNGNELSIDKLAIQSNFPVSKVSFVLFNLEFKGLIKSLPGKIYKRV